MAEPNKNKDMHSIQTWLDALDKDKDMIADDESKSNMNNNTSPKCICGTKLILKKAQSCYDDAKEIECDSCGETIKGNTKVYHCKNKETSRHEEGYDLCKKCALPTALNTDGFDSFIFETLNNTNKNKSNLIISPFSILVAMTICMLGSDKNTLKEMLNVLYCNRKDKSLTFNNSKIITKEIITLCQYFNKEYNGKNGPIVKIANKLWIMKGYKVIKKYIDASGVNAIGSMDNNSKKTANMINKWCSDNTNKMIQEVVTPDDVDEVKLVIANAIYFKGEFVNAFSKSKTIKNSAFYGNKNRNKQISKVNMMHAIGYQYFVQKYEKYYDVVKLEYKRSNLSLILAINNYSIRKRILLTTKDICGLINKWKNKKIDLCLPKFKFEYEIRLNDTLKQMGIIDAFNDPRADFSNMTQINDLFIGAVIHKAVIEVNETGTEAAAVTVVTMKKKKSKKRKVEPPPEIHFDHPFNFYIFDEEKQVVLFSGTYVGKK
eukprot:168248_1